MSNIKINLLEQVASKIAKREVEVQYGACVMAGADGEVGMRDGTPIITLAPWNNNKKIYWTFLHELAHVCLGHTKEVVNSDLKAGSIHMGEYAMEYYKNDPEEHAAKGYARGLDERAHRYAYLHEHYDTKDVFVARLLGLLDE